MSADIAIDLPKEVEKKNQYSGKQNTQVLNTFRRNEDPKFWKSCRFLIINLHPTFRCIFNFSYLFLNRKKIFYML